jgi:hypothetical protein
VTVTALDAAGKPTPGYTGTVHFTSSDAGPGRVLPADYTFVAADNGVHTFTAGVTLVTAGGQTVTATDTSTGSMTGSATVTVSAAAATHLRVTAPGSATAGSPFDVTVTALDPFNNVVTNYAGTVRFTKSDGGAGSAVPADYTFVSGDAGTHTFTRGVTLVTAGAQTVTATDAGGSVTGSAAVSVGAAATSHLGVSGPATATAGAAFSVTVKALDLLGNVATDYTGTVHFVKSDGGPGSAVPADYTFVPADNGVHTFTSGVTLVTAGPQTVTAGDSLNPTLTGQAAVAVSPADAVQLAFTHQPTATILNAPFLPVVTVAALDPFNNVVTADNSDVVTLRLLSNPASATLAGGAGVRLVNGVATSRCSPRRRPWGRPSRTRSRWPRSRSSASRPRRRR